MEDVFVSNENHCTSALIMQATSASALLGTDDLIAGGPSKPPQPCAACLGRIRLAATDHVCGANTFVTIGLCVEQDRVISRSQTRQALEAASRQHSVSS
jgi:hypothetical protein